MRERRKVNSNIKNKNEKKNKTVWLISLSLSNCCSKKYIIICNNQHTAMAKQQFSKRASNHPDLQSKKPVWPVAKLRTCCCSHIVWCPPPREISPRHKPVAGIVTRLETITYILPFLVFFPSSSLLPNGTGEQDPGRSGCESSISADCLLCNYVCHKNTCFAVSFLRSV